MRDATAPGALCLGARPTARSSASGGRAELSGAAINGLSPSEAGRV